MDARITFITLAVADLDASRRFYLDGLGWEAALDSDEVVFIRVGPTVMLSLWTRAGFEAEVGPLAPPGAIPPFTLAHNVATPAEVDAILVEVAAAGAGTVRAAVQREWGGYSGYFTDPDGVFWEVAVNPSPLGQELLDAGAD